MSGRRAPRPCETGRMGELDPGVRELLEGANFVSLATLLEDGGPLATAVWAGVEGERACFFTQPSSLKARNIARDPSVASSVIDRNIPYRTGQLRGRVAETVEGEPALAIIDRLSRT